MKAISTKAKNGDKMLNSGWKYCYQNGMENLVIRPLCYYFIEEVATGKLWIVIILPKATTDLEKFKRNKNLTEDNIRSIMRQIYLVMEYLYEVRDVRHQDIKPNNILINYDESNNIISNIKV